MPTYYRLSDSALRTWADNFYTVCAANVATLGLDVGELASIDTARDNYVAALDASAAAKAASRGATAAKDGEKQDLVDVIANFANQFQTNPAVSDELIGELGLTVRGQGGGAGPVLPASDLSATGCSNGLNQLKWAANTNPSGTNYVIEAAFDGTATWDYVDSTTRTRYDHTGQTPGRPVVYRVIAKRAGETAPPSNEAALYTNGGASLQLLEGGQAAA